MLIRCLTNDGLTHHHVHVSSLLFKTAAFLPPRWGIRPMQLRLGSLPLHLQDLVFFDGWQREAVFVFLKCLR